MLTKKVKVDTKRDVLYEAISLYTHAIPTIAPVLKPVHLPGHAHFEYNVVDCKANKIFWPFWNNV